MKDSIKLTMEDLFNYGFALTPVYNYEKHTWHIKRITKRGTLNVPICNAVTKMKYAPDSVRKIITIRHNGKNISIPLAKFIYVYFDPSHKIEANYYARINENLEDPYLYENIWIESKEEVEKHKNKGNQYHSEKWHILKKS